MLKYACFIAALGMTISVASAADWTGQTPSPALSGPAGLFPFPTSADGFQLNSTPVVLRCNPGATPLPCSGGQHLVYSLAGGASALAAIPAAAGAPGSNLGVSINGGYADPTSPTGISTINGTIPLSAFATSSSVDSLTAQTNQVLQQLQAVDQQLQSQDRTARQGIAASLAMAGTGNLEEGEKFAVSMNWGTFGGQSGVAGGFAMRAADHVTLNGGVAGGVSGGPVGGRAGIRFAW
jgi:hypothetical protein